MIYVIPCVPCTVCYQNFEISNRIDKDLTEITELEQDRKCWRGLASQIEEAAWVSQTKNCDATRQQVKLQKNGKDK